MLIYFPAACALRYLPLESTLVKVHQNKQLYPPLESTLVKNRGRGFRRYLATRHSPLATSPWGYLRVASLSNRQHLDSVRARRNESHDHSRRTPIEDLVRSPRLQRKFPGDVRLHGVRLLRFGISQSILSERHRLLVTVSFADDIWPGVPDQSCRPSGSGPLPHSAP